jgi:GntR family transcriptional regulator
MNVLISNKSELPIYEQIKIQIIEQIISGQLPEDTCLPSIRQLARDLGISVITTTRAYTDLEKEGYIATVQGKGTYVLQRDSNLVREQYLKRIEEAFVNALDYAKTAGIGEEELIEILKNLMGGNL